VRRRIELNQDLPAVAIPSAVMHELCSHALGAAPEECCGLVTGTKEDCFRSVYRITNVMTKKHLADPAAFPRDAHEAYYMSEVEYLRAQQDAEARGETVTAVYHSHVGTGIYLSDEDRAFAEHPLFPFPSAAQIVLSLVTERIVEGGIFYADLQAGPGRFDERGGRRLLAVSDS
jgi:proteasome lid subunit RPN8/RPN11